LPAAAAPADDATRPTRWQADLDYFARALPAGPGCWQNGPPPLAPATGMQRQGAPKTRLRPRASLGLAKG